MNLPSAGREYITWPVEGAPPGLSLEVTFDGTTWHPLQRDGDAVTALIAGPEAQNNPPNAIVLPVGVSSAQIRAVDAPEVVIRHAGGVIIVDPIAPVAAGWPIAWPEGAVTEATTNQRILAEMFAERTLRMLTAYRVGGTPVTLMPARSDVRTYGWQWLGQAAFFPHKGADGKVRNSLPPHNVVVLPAPVGRVDEVRIDGATLPTDAYRVENGNELVRTDGGTWPAQLGTDAFTVTYLNAYPVDALGARAAGVLAEEFLKALMGSNKCRLAPNVTALTRQGVSMQLETGLFPGGVTGIMEVDAYIRLWNPEGLVSPTMVSSIDTRNRHRQVTWRAV